MVTDIISAIKLAVDAGFISRTAASQLAKEVLESSVTKASR